MKRLFLVPWLVSSLVLLLTGQASASSRHQDFVSMTATVSGPRVAHPVVLRGKIGTCDRQRGQRFWNFAIWSGASGSDPQRGIVPTDQRPHVALGQRYVVTFASEGRTAALVLYPFAHDGPWAYIPPDQVGALRGILESTVYTTQPGWWHASGAVGQGLLEILRSQGLTAPLSHRPVVPAPSGSDLPWTVAGAILLILLLALETRRGQREVAAKGLTLTPS
jgi:hypothetical protein